MRGEPPVWWILLTTGLGFWLIVILQRSWPPGTSPFAPKVVHAAASEPATLAELDHRAERRHEELRTQIESLRRQMLALHGKKEIR